MSLFEIFVQDSIFALPLLSWVALALIVLVSEMIFRNPRLNMAIAITGLVAQLALGFAYFSWTTFEGSTSSVMLYFESLRFGSFSQFFNLLIGIVVLCVLLISSGSLHKTEPHFNRLKDHFAEYIICLLLGGFGAAVTVTANDLTAFFLGIETLSVSIYALCGFLRWDIRSTESSLKYLLIGAFSTVILLYGIALLYGATGETNFDAIALEVTTADSSLITLAIMFLIAGLGFKLALIPFHFYTPDVYEGAPTPVTAYMATVVKIATVGAGYRIFWEVLGSQDFIWKPLWLSLCIISILIGNLAALKQRSLKKLLAFSSISHAGFLGLGLLVAEPLIVDSVQSLEALYPLLSYLVVYCALSLGVFGVVNYVEDRDKVFLVDDLKSLGEKRFLVGALFSLFALGLAGIPPFAGFIVKFVVFQELISQGYVWAAIFAVLGSVIAAGYYLKILLNIFMSEDQGAALHWKGLSDHYYSLRFVLAITAILTLIGGLRPSLYSDWIFVTLGIK